MFERKERTDKERNTTSWSVLKWYWLLVPSLYFIFVLPTLTEGAEAQALGVVDLYNFIFHIFNLSLAGILTQTHPLERSKSGAADNVLKMALVQQLISRQIVGIILAGYVWYKLPHKVKAESLSAEEVESSHFQPKTLYILTGIILILTILAIISQFTLL